MKSNFNILLFFLMICKLSSAQSLHHQMISCQGGKNTTLSESHVFFTIGQQSVAGTSSNGVVIQQGFQQSNWSKIIQQNTISVSTTVYPNPFSEVINFSFSNSPGSLINVMVFDFLGRLVHSEVIKNVDNIVSISLNDLPSAGYLVKLTSNNYIYSTKILKQ